MPGHRVNSTTKAIGKKVYYQQSLRLDIDYLHVCTVECEDV